ncbi:MerR family DNA-binding transcriptional regulator [Actinoplanes sp. LDG1-01]|uniref:MerR family DNA-binding transcriptional regulator n=1 Tax=Paractinoplanes lichenicola TaxID=2802976 RepID=A0ABS1VPR0_9ACTN|nr:MerR family DNA-binding transcriptional regulator [Actinoplanes lichenicola]
MARLLTIGKLAAFAGVTVKAVRVYHDRGLLPEPDRDDPRLPGLAARTRSWYASRPPVEDLPPDPVAAASPAWARIAELASFPEPVRFLAEPAR